MPQKNTDMGSFHAPEEPGLPYDRSRFLFIVLSADIYYAAHVLYSH